MNPGSSCPSFKTRTGVAHMADYNFKFAQVRKIWPLIDNALRCNYYTYPGDHWSHRFILKKEAVNDINSRVAEIIRQTNEKVEALRSILNNNPYLPRRVKYSAACSRFWEKRIWLFQLGCHRPLYFCFTVLTFGINLWCCVVECYLVLLGHSLLDLLRIYSL